MKKQDLKTGMTVILRDDGKGKILLNTSNGDVIVFSDSSWNNLDDFNDDMTTIKEGLERFDIMKVYDTHRITKYLQFDLQFANLVWIRTEKEYYLKDNFLDSNSNGYGYLNFEIEDKTFSLSGVHETSDYKTKFTDKEIEELKIPIERFEKIKVEEL